MTLDWSRGGTPLWVGWTKEFRTLVVEDDPVRPERLAAIGKNGTHNRLHKKMTFYFVHLSDWKHTCIESEMTQFSPINECLSLFVTL